MLVNEVFNSVLTTPTSEIFDYLETFLENFGYVTYAYSEESYLVMGPKDLDNAVVGLVCHVDTVGDIQNTLPRVYSDITNPDLLVSAGTYCLDDRTGVAIALSNLFASPVYIFTKGEEVGCAGAITLIEDYPELEMVFGDRHNIHCLIEVDRKGVDEVVFYELDYPEFEQQFTNYEKNLSAAWTDVCILGPMWDVASANVSAAFYKEHSSFEHSSRLDIETATKKLRNTIEIFKNRAEQNLPAFKYRGKSSTCCMLLLAHNHEEPKEDFSLGEEVLEGVF